MAVQSEHLGSTHPDDGTRLCLIALTERLSHFLVMTFLALHLNERRGYSEAEALSLCGLYGGVVYVSAIGGGWLADRLNQHRRAVQVGGTPARAGISGTWRSLWLPIALALAVLTAGHALFKPSLSVLFGRLRGRSGEDQLPAALSDGESGRGSGSFCGAELALCGGSDGPLLSGFSAICRRCSHPTSC
jgi:dipeptide/tripeptide permease